jgi:hypothetical protein
MAEERPLPSIPLSVFRGSKAARCVPDLFVSVESRLSVSDPLWLVLSEFRNEIARSQFIFSSGEKGCRYAKYAASGAHYHRQQTTLMNLRRKVSVWRCHRMRMASRQHQEPDSHVENTLAAFRKWVSEHKVD